MDEVGRGCLAGRVYAAAVILDESFDVSHYTDSKLLSEARRDEFAAEILARHRVGLGYASVDEIFSLNILRATFLAMTRAIEALGVEKGKVLVDGNQSIPGLSSQLEQMTLVKGDLRASPIAAASIVAKVTRDRYMAELGQTYSGYGFEKHKGYGTQEHRDAIAHQGPCVEHRRGFGGVREFWPPRTSPSIGAGL